MSYYLGQKWSTPESVREQRIAEEQVTGSEDLGDVDFDDDISQESDTDEAQ
ncbi:MAG: hypothetical protein Q4B77_00970 [Coriobacteriaceae bacterium]|nr:hypothetical protein [Coriobacteriaceae bacterium]